VLAALVDLEDPAGRGGPLIVPADELERLADDFLASGQVVTLAATSGRHDVLVRSDGATVAVGGHEFEYTTVEVLAMQARALACYDQPPRGVGVVDPEVITAMLDRFPELSVEQRNLVTDFCGSGRGVQSAIGRAGTGKTHAMRAAVQAWQAAGYRVVGTAVKAEAARHLGTECGIGAEPLAWYLNRLEDPAGSPLDARTVLVVDEASTIGDRALGALLAAGDRDGAAIRFVGDPAQHGSIAAGGLWRVMTERFAHRTPELTSARRVRHAGDRRAADALRAGKVAAALAELEDAGHLQIVASERDLYAAMLTRWWHARAAGRPHPMVDRRNDQRLVLNRIARRLLRDMGELGDGEIPAAEGRRFAVGDEVIARMGDRRLYPTGRDHAYVRNGAHGTVIAIEAGGGAGDRSGDQIVVNFDELGEIALPREFFDLHTDEWGRTDVGLDQAYAVTSYAVEGLTFDQSSSHVDPASTRPEVYVDITRGRDANHLFLTAAEDHLAGERLPAGPPEPDRRLLERRLTHSLPEPVAVDLDPLSAPAAAHARTRTLAQLTRECRDERTPASARALAAHAARIREHQIACRAVAHPDPQLITRLGQRPAEVCLARRYDRLLADIAIYRARWDPGRAPVDDWSWALGASVDLPDSAAARARIVGELERFADDVYVRRPTAGGRPGTTRMVPGRVTARDSTPAAAIDRLATILGTDGEARRSDGITTSIPDPGPDVGMN